MRKLIARKTATMVSGHVFVQKGKEYQVVRETPVALIVLTDVTGEHTFFKNPDLKGFYGNYFLLEGEKEESIEDEIPVEEMKEEAAEVKTPQPKNSYNKKRK